MRKWDRIIVGVILALGVCYLWGHFDVTHKVTSKYFSVTEEPQEVTPTTRQERELINDDFTEFCEEQERQRKEIVEKVTKIQGDRADFVYAFMLVNVQKEMDYLVGFYRGIHEDIGRPSVWEHYTTYQDSLREYKKYHNLVFPGSTNLKGNTQHYEMVYLYFKSNEHRMRTNK